MLEHLDAHRKVLVKLFSCPYLLGDHIMKLSDRCHLILRLLTVFPFRNMAAHFCYFQVAGVCPE